jgi:hypothetical protein
MSYLLPIGSRRRSWRRWSGNLATIFERLPNRDGLGAVFREFTLEDAHHIRVGWQPIRIDADQVLKSQQQRVLLPLDVEAFYCIHD